MDETKHPDPETNDATPDGRSDEASKLCETGQGRPDPTRYGDWERAGRCIDF